MIHNFSAKLEGKMGILGGIGDDAETLEKKRKGRNVILKCFSKGGKLAMKFFKDYRGQRKEESLKVEAGKDIASGFLLFVCLSQFWQGQFSFGFAA